MKIAFGTGLFLGESSGEFTYEIQEISGLESPAIRNGNGVYFGEDGGYWVSQYFGLRTVVIKGFSITNCATDANRCRKYFIDRLPLRYVCPIVIEDFNSEYWYLEGCVTDIKADITNSHAMEYQVTVICSDPLIYHGLGLTDFKPLVEEFDIDINGDDEVLFIEQGALYAYPTIDITGIYKTPLTITNQTTGEFIKLDITTTDESDKTLVRIKERAVTLNGSTVNDKLSIDSNWFKLFTGNNHITITSGDPENDTATAKISFSTGFRGI